jgi:hypothetical protein
VFTPVWNGKTEAREDGALFESQIMEIEKHFRAKKSWEEDRGRPERRQI